MPSSETRRDAIAYARAVAERQPARVLAIQDRVDLPDLALCLATLLVEAIGDHGGDPVPWLAERAYLGALAEQDGDTPGPAA